MQVYGVLEEQVSLEYCPRKTIKLQGDMWYNNHNTKGEVNVIDLIKLIAIISVIGYIIYFVVVGGLRFLSELPAINALILFTIMIPFVIVAIQAGTDDKETKKVLDKVGIGFFVVAGILILYYLF